MKTIIGIDGGGTKTEFILCNETGHIQKRLLYGTTNPVDIGLDKACDILKKGICELLEKENGETLAIDGMFIGLSGGSVSDNAAIIHKYIHETFPKANFSNSSDAMNAISVGLLEDDGVILIAGTGSVAFARSGNSLNRVGGWGYLFDGAGGGYDLGAGVISVVLKELDGTGEKTLLTPLLKKELGMNADMALYQFYKKGKRFIASFAPLVFTAFKQGDSVAEKLLDKTILHWTELIKKASTYVPHTKKLAIVGGLFKEKEILLPLLEKKLSLEKEFIIPSLPPVFGALREAFKLADVKVDKIIENNFFESYKNFIC